MPELKYAKYIISEPLSDAELVARGRTPQKREPIKPFSNRLVYLDEKLIKGAFYMEVVLFEPGKTSNAWVKPHVHDTNEILGFISTDVKHPHQLGGEVELWLEDEKYILTKSCLVWVPKGLKHCPLVLSRIDKPVVHFSVLTEYAYLWTDV